MNTTHSVLHHHGYKVAIWCGWRTFMMKMSTAHSALHRHGYKVAICAGVAHIYDENEHHAQLSTPSPIQSSNLVRVAHIYDENKHRAQRSTPSRMKK
jgi:uncharacterized protein YwbE